METNKNPRAGRKPKSTDEKMIKYVGGMVSSEFFGHFSIDTFIQPEYFPFDDGELILVGFDTGE